MNITYNRNYALIKIILAILLSLSTTLLFANSKPISIKTINVGESPKSITLNTVTNKVYVNNNDDSTISVINGFDNKVSTINKVNADGIAINSVTNMLYTNYMLIMDGSNNKIIPANYDTPYYYYPNNTAVNPVSNIVYITNFGDDTVSVFSGTSNIIPISKIENVGHFPKGIAVNPNTNKIYVANQGSDNISVIDGITNIVTSTIKAGGSPWGIVVNPNTNKIYVANTASNSVYVIDGTTNVIIATIGVGESPEGITVNTETNTIYVANYKDNTISVIDGIDNKIINTITVGSSPCEVAVNSDTNILYVVNRGSNTVSVITNPDSILYKNSVNTSSGSLLRKTINDKLDNIFTKLDQKYQKSNKEDYIKFLTNIENKIDIILQSVTLSERNRMILDVVKSRIENKLDSFADLL